MARTEFNTIRQRKDWFEAGGFGAEVRAVGGPWGRGEGEGGQAECLSCVCVHRTVSPLTHTHYFEWC